MLFKLLLNEISWFRAFENYNQRQKRNERNLHFLISIHPKNKEKYYIDSFYFKKIEKKGETMLLQAYFISSLKNKLLFKFPYKKLFKKL